MAEGEAETVELLDNLTIPGVSKGVSPEEFDGLNAGLLRQAIEEVTSSADKEGSEAVRDAAT